MRPPTPLRTSPEHASLTALTDRFGSVGEVQLAAEQRARVLIDRQLADAGWTVQHKKDLNLFAGQGVAVRAELSSTLVRGQTLRRALLAAGFSGRLT